MGFSLQYGRHLVCIQILKRLSQKSRDTVPLNIVFSPPSSISLSACERFLSFFCAIFLSGGDSDKLGGEDITRIPSQRRPLLREDITEEDSAVVTIKVVV